MSETEHTYEDAKRALEGRETFKGTFTLHGEVYPLEVREPTYDELDEIENSFEDDDAGEYDFVREAAREYLLEPEVDVGSCGITKIDALFEGMKNAWEQSDVFDEAEAEMPVDSGNAQTSPTSQSGRR